MEKSETLPITVIIPSYNHEKYVSEAIESVLDQSQKPSQIIVVDDCSNDSSRSVLQQYSSFISIIHHDENMGGAETLNTGVTSSTQEFIAILNSDDTWASNKLERQFDYMQSNALDACFTQATIMNSKSEILENPPRFFSVFEMTEPTGGSYLHHFFYKGNFLCHPSLLVKRNMYSKAGLYNGGLDQLPDFAKWIDFTKVGQIGILPEKLINYRYLESENASSQKTLQNQIRTRNEMYLIFSTIFDGIPIARIEDSFKDELSRLTGIYKDVAAIDPATALLLTNPEGSLAKQALYAGILRLQNKSNIHQGPGRIFLRSVLSQLEIDIKTISIDTPPDVGDPNTRFMRFSKKLIARILND